MPRRKTDEQVLLDAATPTKEERAKAAAKKIERLEKRIERAMTGGSYHGKEIHEAYPKAETLRKQIVSYFKICEMKKKPMTIPGLALAIGVRTSVVTGYSPIEPRLADHRKVIEYAIQRIETYLADSLCTGTGSTKGREFLAMNTLGYAAKSQVNSTASLEITDKDRVKGMSDEELKTQAKSNIEQITKLIPNLREFKASGQ